MRAAPLVLLVVVLPLAAAEPVAERFHSVTFDLLLVGFEPGGPTGNYQAVASFDPPDEYDAVYLHVDSIRTTGVGVVAMNHFQLVSPSGSASAANADNGFGVRFCWPIALQCDEERPPESQRSPQLTNEPGTWTIDYYGATTSAYTLGVYGIHRAG